MLVLVNLQLNNVQYSKNYTSYTGIDSGGNDIPGAGYGNATVEQCQSTCDSNPECAGFVTNTDGSICWPKTSSMYPTGKRQINTGYNLYTRNKIPTTTPMGVTNVTNNIDSITYKNYINGGELKSKYGLAIASYESVFDNRLLIILVTKSSPKRNFKLYIELSRSDSVDIALVLSTSI